MNLVDISTHQDTNSTVTDGLLFIDLRDPEGWAELEKNLPAEPVADGISLDSLPIRA
jgi:hypothetical protein